MIKSENKISLCLIAANREHLLREMLESIRKQSNTNFDLIVSDDSNIEASSETLGLLPKNSIYMRNDPPLGEAANSNQVIRAASTEYIALIHDDDKLHFDYVEQISQFLKAHDVDVLMVNQEYIDENGGQVYCRELDDKSKFIWLDPRKLLEKSLNLERVHPIYTPGLVFKRRLLDKIEFSNSIGTHIDTNFILKLLVNIDSLVILNQYLYYSRISSNSGRGKSSRKGNVYLEQINIYEDFYRYLNQRKLQINGFSFDKTVRSYIKNIVLSLNNPFFWTAFHNKNLIKRFVKLLNIYKSIIDFDWTYAFSVRLNLILVTSIFMPTEFIRKRYNYFIKKIK